MKKQLFTLFLMLLVTSLAWTQTSIPAKYFPKYTTAGDVYLLNSNGEFSGVSTRSFTIHVNSTAYFNIYVLANLPKNQEFRVYINNAPYGLLTSRDGGWQYYQAEAEAVKLPTGKHTIMFVGNNTMVPMVEELFVMRSDGRQSSAAVESFLQKVEMLKQQPVTFSSKETPGGNLTSKVLPNPEGEYAHAIDTAFVYSHFSWIYLSAGTYTFTTANSTISRSLAVFKNGDYSSSSANINSGPGGESYVWMYVPTAAYYGILVRPAANGATGITDILMNGSVIVNDAIIAGKYYSTPQLRGGAQNFFTCKITGDTRIFVSRYASSSVRDYNDDYAGTGSWNWGLSSRVSKTYNGIDSVQYTYICAYSPTSTGICDIYMGCGNSNLHQLEPNNFPLLYDNDAIRSAPQNGSYNCISWSGGLTNTWIWPPSSYSTYSCTSANYLLCFDNYYSNNPVRYPGAWNYTRTGATSANSVVDLWKTASAYTHASVKEPGNNHPHGYDWESKPGGLNRTFHPRNALEQPNWYGAVSNYYRATGTYARNGAEQYFTTDADAVKAGLAIFDKAALTKEAGEKLSSLMEKNSPSLHRSFNELYDQWEATKATNASHSNPAMYCQNKEYKALEAFALANRNAAMLLAFDKFIKGDHPVGELILTLTNEKYGKLLDEVKTERLANLYDKEGRYRIHGDHDNGVLYIEKILKGLTEEPVAEPVADVFTVSVSPNPVADKLTVQVNTTKSSKISVVVVSAQTGMKRALQPETILPAGTHRFESFVKDIVGSNGNMLAVQVTVDGVMKTTKVMVMR